jgi:hypothetical protein
MLVMGENTASGLCQCGCGQPAPIATRTVRSRGRVKGQPMRFIRGHNSGGMNRSGPRIEDRWSIEDHGHQSACWVWQLKTNGTGYGYETVNGKHVLAHRHAYEQSVGPIPEGMQIDHLCGVRLCVNPAHLEAVTPMENTRRSRTMKLTLDQAIEIEAMFQRGDPRQQIADRFGVSRETVNLIGTRGAHATRRPHRSAR